MKTTTMTAMKTLVVVISLSLLVASTAAAEGDRDSKVLGDRNDVQAGGLWIYNDLPRGIAEARKTGKPLLIVFR